MGLSKTYKKYTSVNIIKNSYNGDKVRFTKVRNGQTKYSTPLSHQGFYDLEIQTAVTLVENTGLKPGDINVLDIGFGLGYSAQKFIDMGVGSYTSIEINDDLYTNALYWSWGMETSTSITILNGEWEAIMSNLADWGYKYNIIYYGMFDEIGNYNNLNDFKKASTRLSNPGTLLSIQGLPLFRNINLDNQSVARIEMNIPWYAFDNVFTWSLYTALNNYGYFNVYYQYFDGRNWTNNPRGGGGGIEPPCIDCLPIGFM